MKPAVDEGGCWFSHLYSRRPSKTISVLVMGTCTGNIPPKWPRYLLPHVKVWYVTNVGFTAVAVIGWEFLRW